MIDKSNLDSILLSKVVSFHDCISVNDVNAVAKMIEGDLAIVDAPNPYDDNDTSPLQRAIAKGSIEMVSTLVKFGADTNWCSVSGWRPLHFAISATNPSIIKILIFNGADANISNAFIPSSFVFAIDRNLSDQLIEVFLAFGKLFYDTIQDGLRIAIHNCHQSHIRLLIEYGANPCEIETDPEMPRFVSFVSDEDINLVKKLINDLKIFISDSGYGWENVNLQNLYNNRYDSEYVKDLINYIESNADDRTLVTDAIKTISEANKLYFRILNDKGLFICMHQYGRNVLSKVEFSGFFSLKPQLRVDKLKKYVTDYDEAIKDNKGNIGEKIVDEAIWGLGLERIEFQITETDLLGNPGFDCLLVGI